GREERGEQDEAEQEEDREPQDRCADAAEHRVLAGDHEADHRDRGEGEDLRHREDRVADHLPGEQGPGRDRRDEELDHASLLLLHHALRDRAAERGRRHEEHDAEADGDEVAQERVRRRRFEDLHLRRLRERHHERLRGLLEHDDPVAERRIVARDERGLHGAIPDQPLGFRGVGRLGDLDALVGLD
ncbi:hypothetical protein ABE10_31560, partial [Bacillus toyonensis]|nr:hypothetical protein [Bacillus toyonensis]